jgi:hypothetical protein
LKKETVIYNRVIKAVIQVLLDLQDKCIKKTGSEIALIESARKNLPFSLHIPPPINTPYSTSSFPCLSLSTSRQIALECMPVTENAFLELPYNMEYLQL